MSNASPQIRIGISGWRYAPWRGTFYPPDLPQKRELEYAGEKLNSLEINGTFYSLQSPSSFQTWRDAVPDDFVFSIKGGRFITHMKRLRDVRIPLATFFASGLLLLNQKLGPILWQFPPNFQLDLERFEAFFELLPRSTEQAAELARAHRPKMKHGSASRTDADRPLRHAVEVRHQSFRNPAFVKLLRKHSIALVVSDAAGQWPSSEDVTADFIYARLHGAEELYASGYTDQALDRWAKKFAAWSAGDSPPDAKTTIAPPKKSKPRDLFIYFDNDKKVRAPFDAMSLAQRLNSSPTK